MPGLTTEQFLAASIRHSKNKIEVDFTALAEETGMSVGGAYNKFRAIMKQIEDERATVGDGAAAAAPVTPKKRRSKAAGVDGEGSSKKPRSVKKKTAPKDIEESEVKGESGEPKPKDESEEGEVPDEKKAVTADD